MSRALSAAVSTTLAFAASGAHAGPENGVVTTGSATISTPEGGLTRIDQSTHAASIDWQAFNVSAQERVIFNQPSANSITLNRILQQDPSRIHGSISANGRLFLINPNGIIFGATSRINVGSLVASSLDITDSDAALGRFSFSTLRDQSGAVINDGVITAAAGGSVTLLGGSIANNGVIVADYGSVNLGAGRAATLDFFGDGLMRFEIDADLVSNADGATAAVSNTGEIRADGGQVLLTAGQAREVIDRAVNNEGVVRAARIENTGGRIRLLGTQGTVSNSGILDASGVGASAGGEVQVLGERVELRSTSIVDVSGTSGGGAAFIGGGFRGEDPALLNSQQTDVDAGAVIRADSLASGDGGNVAVWSDGRTTFGGEVLARALGMNGNGGFAEVSGHEHLRMNGTARLTSVNGVAGTLLLDPGSVSIVNGNGNPSNDDDVFSDGWISNFLQNSGSLTISTNNSANTGTENLTMSASAAIAWTTGNTLELIGDASIALSGSILSSTGAGSLILRSDGDISANGAINLANGSLTVDTSGGNVTIADTLNVGGAATITAGADININGSTTTTGLLTLDAGQDITQSAAIIANGGITLAVGNSRSVSLGNSGNTFNGAMSMTGGGGVLGDVTLYDSNALNLPGMTVTGTLDVSSEGALTQSGVLTVTGAAIFRGGAGQSITLSLGNSFAGNVSILALSGQVGDLTLRDTTTLGVSSLALSGDLDLNAPSINPLGAFSVGGNSLFQVAGGSALALSNPANSFAGTVDFASNNGGNVGSLTLVNNRTVDLEAFALSGNLTVTANGSIQQSGALSIGGDSSFTVANGSSITLDAAGNAFSGPNLTLATSGGGALQNVSLRDSTALALGALNLDGNLSLNGSSIAQTAAWTVDGNSTFTTNGGQTLSLTQANQLDGRVSFVTAGGGALSVTLHNAMDLDLGGSTLGGNLIVTANGSITQSNGALLIGGDSSFTAAQNGSITLNTVGNTFSGANLALLSSGPGNLQSVSIRDTSALTLGTLSLDGALSATSGAALTLGQLTATSLSATAGGVLSLGQTTLTGDLSATTSGGISQTGSLSIGGASSFTAGGGQSIDLSHTGNNFSNASSFALAAQSGNLLNVTVFDTTALQLQALSIAGSLNITAGGPITQSGALSVAGSAALRTRNDAGALIQLDGTNTFGSVTAAVRNLADSANAAANITIHESNATTLGNVQTGAAQSVTVVSAGAITAQGGTSITAGSLTLNAVGDIGAPGGSIALSSSSGQIDAVGTGSVYLAHTGGGVVELDRIVAGASGDVAVTSDGGMRVVDVRAGDAVSLSSGGNIVDDNVNGAGSRIVGTALSLQAAGAIGEASGVGAGLLDIQTVSLAASAQGGGIYIDQASGDMNLRTINAAGAVRLSAAAGSIVDDAIDVGAASVVSSSGGIQLAALNNIGTVTDLRTRQGAAIAINTSGGPLSANVSSTTGQINLNLAAGSNPTATAGSISAGGSGTLLIQSSGDLSLDSFSAGISGMSAAGFSSNGVLRLPDLQSGLVASPLATLVVRGGVDIVQSDRAFDFAATHLVFESGGQGGDVALNTAVTSLDASLGGSASLSVVDASALTLGTISAGGNVSIRATDILDDGDASGATRVTAGNSVSLSAANSIGQTDGTGAGRVDTSATAVSVQADTGSVYLSHAGDVQLSGTANGGAIDALAATSNITVNGALRAGGALALTAGTDAVGATPAVVGNITLAGLAQSGSQATLNARGGGSVADANDSTTHLAATGAHLSGAQIGAQSNGLSTDLTWLTANATNGVFISEANALQVRDLVGSSVAIAAGGDLIDDGDVQTRINATTLSLSAARIGATGTGNEIGTAVDSLSATASAGAIHLNDVGDLQLGTLSASGNLNITASGAIVDDGDSGTRSSGSNLTFVASSIGAIDRALDVEGATLAATASNGGIFISEAGDVQLNAIGAAAGRDVAIVAGGALTDDGSDSTRVAGANVSLHGTRIGTADNRIDTSAGALTATAASGGVYIDEADNVTLADVRSSGTGNIVELRTGGNGNITVQNLITQGGAVNLTAGGSGSLDVTGAIASNNGVVNLIAGNALAVPGLNTGAGSVVLRTVNDLNVGTISAGSIAITSDTGNISLGTVNAGNGVATITANNGVISDGAAISLTAGEATLTARSIGSEGNPLNLAVGSLTAVASGGGIFIEDVGGLTVSSLAANGRINLTTSGDLIQTGSIASTGNAIALFARQIDMQRSATTLSGGGEIAYIATAGDLVLGSLNASTGRVLAIAADDVFSSLEANSSINNLFGSVVEVRAGGLGTGEGQIGTAASNLSIATPASALRNVFLVVPVSNGLQASTPRIKFSGSTSALLLKGYSGTTGALLFDRTGAFTPDTVLLHGESIVPLAETGRIAVNADSLSAAKQALSSGVVTRVNVDWAAFDPNVSLFSTLDTGLRLPADQVEEAIPE